MREMQHCGVSVLLEILIFWEGFKNFHSDHCEGHPKARKVPDTSWGEDLY